MPLDPQAREFLEAVETSGVPAIETLTPVEARAAMTELYGRMVSPENVADVEDRDLPGSVGRIPARVYRPVEAATGTLIFYHGGGWVRGDLDTHDALCRSLAAFTPCVVIAIDYRLAPEHPFPAAVDDAVAAYHAVVRHAGSLDIDPGNIACGGDSAGGNLAAVCCSVLREQGGTKPRCQVLIYPVTADLDTTESQQEFAEGYSLTAKGMRWYFDHYLPNPDDRQNPRAIPLAIERLQGLPSALIITAEYDPLRDEGERYAERLQEAGVPVALQRYDGMIHGFVALFPMFTQGRQAVLEIVAYLRATFSRQP